MWYVGDINSNLNSVLPILTDFSLFSEVIPHDYHDGSSEESMSTSFPIFPILNLIG
jgi:hypothetical protein